MKNMNTISNVEVLEKLGAGNFGEVYKGTWKVIFLFDCFSIIRELQLL